ncbi:MAG: hypothetical protein COA86_02785 [Kangiella sp.]|nr:MAG: hypothetical protein COA86_02785 [Kangiella sp.]
MSELSQLTNEIVGMRKDLNVIRDDQVSVGKDVVELQTHGSWMNKELELQRTHINNHDLRIGSVERRSLGNTQTTKAQEWTIRLFIGGVFAVAVELIKLGLTHT